jgi:hypothetical protein
VVTVVRLSDAPGSLDLIAIVTTSGDCLSGVSKLKLPSGPLNSPWKPLSLVLSQATHYGACLRTAKVAEFSWRGLFWITPLYIWAK